MLYDLCHLFLIFFISSVIGYISEIIFCSINSKKIVLNRGFLMGPYIPIYGVGTVLVTFFLYRYRDDPFVFFWMTVVLCTFVEYLTSYIMEKIFKVRWWDYSQEPFNYNGRVCLKNSMIFGIAGLLVAYTVYPFICNLLNLFSPFMLEIIAIILFIIFTSDLTFTITTLFGVRKNLVKFKGRDITEVAHEELVQAAKKNNFFINRLLQAFPSNEQFNHIEFVELKKAVSEYRSKKKQKKEDKV